MIISAHYSYVIIVLVFSLTFVVIIALPILMAIVVLAHVRLGENTGKLRYVTTALFMLVVNSILSYMLTIPSFCRVLGVLLGLTVVLLISSSIAFVLAPVYSDCVTPLQRTHPTVYPVMSCILK